MRSRSRVLVIRPEHLRWNVAAGLEVDHRVLVADESDRIGPDEAAVDVVLLVGHPDDATIRRCRDLAGAARSLIAVTFDPGPEAQVAFFRAGADDVVPATVPGELLRARIEVQLRRSGMVPDRIADQLQIGALRLDPATLTAEIDRHPLHLPPSVFQVLHTLASNLGKVVPTGSLHSTAAEGETTDGHGNAVRIAISRLRRALGDRPDVPVIETVRLVGYRLQPPGRPIARVFAAHRG